MTVATLLHASAHDTGLPAGSVHMIATSPPYWGLRKYAGDQDVEWPTVEYTPMAGLPEVTVQGCEPGCQHEWADGPVVDCMRRDSESRAKIDGSIRNIPGKRGTKDEKATQGAYCVHCGGWRGPLGLEPDPLAYVAHIVLVFRELWRVLRDDGVAWLNLGDSYNSGASGGLDGSTITGGQTNQAHSNRNGRGMVPGLKPKDLCMIPARVALALQADGWTLRSAIVWAKGVSFLPDYAGSVMPESVTDRPTKAHEMVYLLSKRARYYWDAEAVKENAIKAPDAQKSQYKYTSDDSMLRTKQGIVDSRVKDYRETGRNLRDVWVINPAGYAGAHFATWPEALVRPMVLAGSSARGVCPVCAAPWRRVVERTGGTIGKSWHTHANDPEKGMSQVRFSGGVEKAVDDNGQHYAVRTIGWEPTCTCAAAIPEAAALLAEHGVRADFPDLSPVPATVLDPFSGSGTTGRVAMALGRNYIGVDLAGEYHDTLAVDRLSNLQMEMTL